MNVDSILRRLTWAQLTEWMAYEELEPFGTHRADIHAASICAAVMNAMAIQVQSKKRFKVKDFLLKFGEPEEAAPTHTKEAPAWQQHKMIAQMFVALSRAEEKKKANRKKR